MQINRYKFIRAFPSVKIRMMKHDSHFAGTEIAGMFRLIKICGISTFYYIFEWLICSKHLMFEQKAQCGCFEFSTDDGYTLLTNRVSVNVIDQLVLI